MNASCWCACYSLVLLNSWIVLDVKSAAMGMTWGVCDLGGRGWMRPEAKEKSYSIPPSVELGRRKEGGYVGVGAVEDTYGHQSRRTYERTGSGLVKLRPDPAPNLLCLVTSQAGGVRALAWKTREREGALPLAASSVHGGCWVVSGGLACSLLAYSGTELPRGWSCVTSPSPEKNGMCISLSMSMSMST